MDADIFFETEDFAGRKIICTKEQWDHHICDTHHSYMEACVEEVIDALKKPLNGFRCFDKNQEKYPKKRIYYSLAKSKDYYTKVIVEFENKAGEGLGVVITAFQPDKISNGEKPELRNE